MSRQRLLVLSLVCALALGGCSANRFLYNRADTFVRWAIDDYVDLTTEQQKQFDADLDAPSRLASTRGIAALSSVY